MQNFSRRLDTAISKSGKKKGDLAKHCDVALSTVSRWMGGTVPGNETLTKIAEFLGVDAVWLLTGVDRTAASEMAKVRDSILHGTPNSGNFILKDEPHDSPQGTGPEQASAVIRIAAALERIAAAMERAEADGKSNNNTP